MSSVDVIIPCYNYGKYLRDCVQSVLSQGGIDVRVLIIDDASPDDTPEVARALVAADPRVSYRRHESNLRHIATYNEGIEWVSATYYLLLSADDYLVPGALQRAVQILDADPSVVFCFGMAVEEFPDGQRRLANDHCIDISEITTGSITTQDFIQLCEAAGAANIVPTPTAVVRTAFQKETAPYRPELPHSADMELWLRLAVLGRVGIVSDVQAVYRRHATNMSLGYMGTNRLLDIEQRALAVELFAEACKSQFSAINAAREALLRRLALQAVHAASAALNEGRPDLFEEGRDRALRLDPQVSRTWLWGKLWIKRLIWNRMLQLLLGRGTCRDPRPLVR